MDVKNSDKLREQGFLVVRCVRTQSLAIGESEVGKVAVCHARLNFQWLGGVVGERQERLHFGSLSLHSTLKPNTGLVKLVRSASVKRGATQRRVARPKCRANETPLTRQRVGGAVGHSASTDLDLGKSDRRLDRFRSLGASSHLTLSARRGILRCQNLM